MSNILEIPKNLQRKIALELSPPELIRFCLTRKNVNTDICESKEFWRLKLQKDYPEVFNYFTKGNLILRNPKNTYIRRFKDISSAIEDFVKKEISLQYQPIMYDIIYKVYQEYVLRKRRDERIEIKVENIFNEKILALNPQLTYPNPNIYLNKVFDLALVYLVSALETKRKGYFAV